MSVQPAVGSWLTEAYDYEPPRRGQMRRGIILKLEAQGIIVDIGLKRDGFIPRTDVEQLEEETFSTLKPGQEVETRILRPQDQDGIHILSLYQARVEQEWIKAREMWESGEIFSGQVVGCNRGGLLVKFGHLQAFVPASHVSTWPRGKSASGPDQARFVEQIGQELPLKIIEVNRDKKRLILSERLASGEVRREEAEKLWSELVEGEVRRGKVCHLTNFGAFIDLGGMDGLIHISELAWTTVRHPGDVVQVGDEIDVYVLKLDLERKRISLSLKRLQPNPWVSAYKNYAADQLVTGTVTNVVDFGAFVALEGGLEGLIHVSELADPPPEQPRDLVKPGDRLVVRILNIDVFRQRLALSLKSAPEATEPVSQ
jgi:small subunit ribosomal protein S1